MHRIKTHLKLVAAGALLASTCGATAADLYGGGATLTAPAYVGDLYNTLSPRARLSRDSTIVVPAVSFSVAGLGNAGSTAVPAFARYHGLFTSDAASYCQTGSATGKRIFNNDGVLANGACGDAAGPSPTGFSAVAAAPDFIGTDLPIDAADYNAFIVNVAASRTAILQVPVLASAIAFPFKDDPVSGLTALSLNTQQICRIYAASITDWGDPALGLSLSPGPHPITIAYRNDGSGATLALTRYLSAKCNGQLGIAAGFFKPNESFVAAVSQAGVMPAYAAVVGRGGDSALVAAVDTTAHALGYSAVAEAISQGVMYATVNGFDPAALPGVISITPANLWSGLMTGGVPVPSSVPAAAANCLRLVSPTVSITTTYPVVAVSYLNAYYAGNASAKIVPLKNLLNLFYDGINRPALPVGYAYVDGNALFRSSARTSVNNCIN